MLYQIEVGKSDPVEAIATYWPAREQDEQLGEPLREFANGLVRGAVSRR